MQIGIGLPSAIPWRTPSLILEWAKRAEERSFASLGLVDRIVYPNYESLVTLAVAAGATQRIGLVTSVLLAPLRNTALLAKQAASLDNLSGGRLTLGLGIGSREDDFRATQQPFKNRGRRFDEQLQQLKSIWAGQPLSDDVGPIGPTPVRSGGPEILIGGNAPEAIERVARWGNGYIAGGVPPGQAGRGYENAKRAWQAAGRPGKPRFVAAMYYALGADAAERGARYIRDYYAFLGQMVEGFARSLPSTPDAVRAAFEAYVAVGADEVIAWPTIAELDQIELLADVVAKSGLG